MLAIAGPAAHEAIFDHIQPNSGRRHSRIGGVNHYGRDHLASRSCRGVGFGELAGFIEKCLDDVMFGDGAQDFALDEDLPFAIARTDTEVGFTGFAWPVNDATHDSDAKWVWEV